MSPLTEVNKEALAELFQKDPFLLTKDDIKVICQELRKARERWMKDDFVKTSEKKTKVTMSAKEMEDLLNSI